MDLSSATEGNISETTTSIGVKKPGPQQTHSVEPVVNVNLPTPATTLSSGESDSEGQQGIGASSVKTVPSGDGICESISLPSVVVNTTAVTTSSSGGSGDEGGGGVSGTIGGGRRETKRKLFDLPEELAPKRRSSRVSHRMRYNCR